LRVRKIPVLNSHCKGAALPLLFVEFLVGSLIGFAIGATGIGGGTLMAPALIFALGFPARTAVATALLFSSIVKLLASGIYLSHRKVDARVLAYLLCGGLPGAIIGAIVLEGLRSKKSEAWVLLTVAIIVIVSAALSLFRFKTANAGGGSRLYLLPPFSFLIGLETGFSSAGAGALGTVMLFNLTALVPSLVVGTDLVFGMIVSTVAGGIHVGSCDFAALAKLVPAGIAGVLVGSRVSVGWSVNTLRKAVLLCTILAGVLLLRKGIAGIL
jgi:uncharacterized protein